MMRLLRPARARCPGSGYFVRVALTPAVCRAKVRTPKSQYERHAGRNR